MTSFNSKIRAFSKIDLRYKAMTSNFLTIMVLDQKSGQKMMIFGPIFVKSLNSLIHE